MVSQSDSPVIVAGLGMVVDIAAGTRHVCSLDADGNVSCWGGNEEGQLGDGSLDHLEECMPGSALVDCSSTPVSVTLPASAIAIESGLEHSCALLMSGEVYCWGYNDQRQLGDGTRERQASPVQVMGLES
jgi:alpha-tubulin suppressor-like RCC1 family protein